MGTLPFALNPESLIVSDPCCPDQNTHKAAELSLYDQAGTAIRISL
ncbi:MAG: hypothetical protein HOH09_10885 [Proteobacteria bacterium]|nr:hypothetical protein [Pseudomonadota bacterium]